MVIDLTTQRAFVYRDGTLIGVSVIASGKRGYETPRGTFTVLEKERHHHSNKYDNAPMPYMQRLSWSGLALHGGHPRGHPASHGCIRLPMGFAAALFKENTQGMQVAIRGYAQKRPKTVIANRANSHRNSHTPTIQTESDDQGDVRADTSRVAPGQLQNDQDYIGQEQGEAERSDEVPPPDLPPPPG